VPHASHRGAHGDCAVPQLGQRTISRQRIDRSMPEARSPVCPQPVCPQPVCPQPVSRERHPPARAGRHETGEVAMDTPTFVYRTYIGTTPQRLWRALTEPALLMAHVHGGMGDCCFGPPGLFRPATDSRCVHAGGIITSGAWPPTPPATGQPVGVAVVATCHQLRDPEESRPRGLCLRGDTFEHVAHHLGSRQGVLVEVGHLQP